MSRSNCGFFIMANWTTEPQPFGANHVPLLTGLSSVDGVTPVPVAVDPATGEILTAGGGGGGGNVTIVGPLGQSLAAASIPVVLTAAQIATLTPLSTIKIDQTTPGSTNNISLSAKDDSSGSQALVTTHNVNGSTESLNVFVQNSTAGSPLGRVTLTDNNNSNQANITAASTAAAATDEGLVVSVSPNSLVKLAAETTKVIGTVNQGTSPWVVSSTAAADGITTGTISAPDAVVGAPAGSGATVTGASTAGSLVALSVPSGSSSWMIQASGTFGGTSVYFEASSDSTNGTNGTWISINSRLEGINNTSIAQGIAGAAVARGTVSSFTYIRARAVGGSGLTIAIRIETSTGVGGVFLNASLPTGSNAIGSITNTTFIATQATAANFNATVVNAAGSAIMGKVGIDQTTVGITNAVSIAQIGTTTIVTGGVNGTQAVGGITATGATKTGNPVRIGAVGHTANPSAVTDGQAVDVISDKLGKLVAVGSIRDMKANQITTITASVTETTIVTSVASVFLDMYGIIITNTSATAVNVAIKDATAGTTRFNLAVPAGDTRGFMLPEGGAIKQAAVTNNWTATVSTSVTSVIITALTVQNL